MERRLGPGRCRVREDALEVLFEGLVFRFAIRHDREIHLLRTQGRICFSSAADVTWRDVVCHGRGEKTGERHVLWCCRGWVGVCVVVGCRAA